MHLCNFLALIWSSSNLALASQVVDDFGLLDFIHSYIFFYFLFQLVICWIHLSKLNFDIARICVSTAILGFNGWKKSIFVVANRTLNHLFSPPTKHLKFVCYKSGDWSIVLEPRQTL